MRSIRLFLIIASSCLVLNASSWAQGPRTAKPVKGAIRVRPVDNIPDDIPSEYIVLFGNATVGANFRDADSSTVNVAQLGQSLKDLAAFKIPVSELISIGGLVFNGSVDRGKTLVKRLDACQKFIKNSTKAELHCVLGSEARGVLGVADPVAVEAWRTWTQTAGWTNVGQKATHMDYAYSKGKRRMVFIDTEHADGIETEWLGREIEKAEADKSIEHIFIFGARPLAKPIGVNLDEKLSSFIAQPSSEKARRLIAGRSKVVGYFCGDPAFAGQSPLQEGSQTMQVVVGNGGGPLSPAWESTGKAGFGFNVVTVYPNGNVAMVSFNRPAPSKNQAFYASGPEVPRAATLKTQVTLWTKPRNANKG